MLRISEMTCRLPHGRLIVDRLNLVLEKGQNMVVQGPSGSGSPSLLILLLILLLPRLRLRLRLLC
jgi:ABC-type taurine transport system ATPase subunit